MSFTISPPVRWTYFLPIATTGIQVTNFFPGQSETSQDAQQAAQNEIMAAYLEALSDSNYPVNGNQLQTTVTYTPDPISNCYTGQPIPASTRIGYLAGGAVTQTALVSGTGGAGVTVSACPLSSTMITTGVGQYEEYLKPVAISTRGGVTMTRFTWERVANQMQSILNFRYNVLFQQPIVVTN